VSSIRVWAAAAALTFAYCEGAGFGAFSYHCLWFDARTPGGPFCTLTSQALMPPAVPWGTFTSNVATLWLAGVFDGGLVVGIVLSIALFVVASRLSYDALRRAFSVLPVSIAGAVLCAAGYAYVVQQTFATGMPR
jgi:hypothetical protein